MTLNDLEPPKEGLVNFSQFLAAAHISTVNCELATKWLKIDQDNLHMKFLVLNKDFSNLSYESIDFQGGLRKHAPSGVDVCI